MPTQNIKIDAKLIARDPKDNSTTFKLTRDVNSSTSLTTEIKYTLYIENGLETNQFENISNIGEKLLTGADISPEAPNLEQAYENFKTNFLVGFLSANGAMVDEFSIHLVQDGINFGLGIK